MFVAVVLLSCLLAAVFFFSGGRKVRGGDAVAVEAAHLGLTRGSYSAIGVAELLGGLGLLVGLTWQPLGVLAAGALSVLMVGAVGSHLRIRDGLGRVLPAAAIAMLAAATAAFAALA